MSPDAVIVYRAVAPDPEVDAVDQLARHLTFDGALAEALTIRSVGVAPIVHIERARTADLRDVAGDFVSVSADLIERLGELSLPALAHE